MDDLIKYFIIISISTISVMILNSKKSSNANVEKLLNIVATLTMVVLTILALSLVILSCCLYYYEINYFDFVLIIAILYLIFVIYCFINYVNRFLLKNR